ncbi:pfs domain-containing protein [Colletotrichum orchidophilum]|uniref:Pfs domain-containing protein n=1 Tax=Colletotrichum orchidophilum TaxID=1209926 RepID=A0A1G4BRX1_9PEZI|nr:pfs domain-containing protein [Colletotrichum orchidophilum]OHF04036.1 pfs domain-containing protein [Colletotrichum orchidophilum]
MSDPQKYTVGWICAIATEFAAAQLFFDEVHEDPISVSKHDNNAYKLGRIGGHNVVVAVLPDGEYGTNSAAAVGRDMLHTFENVRIGLMVGIGGGAPSSRNDIRLGDVVTIQNQEFDIRGHLDQPPFAIRTAVNALKGDLMLQSDLLEREVEARLHANIKEAFGRPGLGLDNLYHSHVVHIDGRSHPDVSPDVLVARKPRTNPQRPAIHYGLIASANQLMKDALVRDKLAEDHGVLCFEMEAAGLMNHFPCIVVRGICDYADSHKNDIWQGYAALVAAGYAKALLSRVSRVNLEGQGRISDVLSEYFKTHTDYGTLGNLKTSRGAQFDTYDDQNEPRCLEDTRVDLLQRIHTWASDVDDRRMFWLSGLAGTGKSTISRTVAQNLNDLKLLGATFFFKRGESDRSNGSLFFSTIARQLVNHRSQLRPHLVQTIKESSDISDKNMREQFDKLILGPLEAAFKEHRAVRCAIIVDALDECDNRGDINLLIPMLHELTEATSCKVKVFLTSRPDTAVHFGRRPILGWYREFILHEVEEDVIEHDIRVFLEYELTKIKENWNAENDDQLAVDWPGDQRLQMLTQKATPLFIFAATACRFIEDSLLGSPETQLRQMINHKRANRGATVDDKLEETYLPVLERLLVKRSRSEQASLLERFNEIVGTIFLLEEPLTIKAIGTMLAVEPKDIASFITPLRSIIDTRGNKDQPLKLFHTSFRDFLLCPGAGVFRVDWRGCHRRLGLASLELLHTREPLRENCCGISPGTERKDIPAHLIDNRFPSHVRYACIHWVGHLTEAQYELRASDHVHEFLKTHLLHWIEALTILGEAAISTELAEALSNLPKTCYKT